MQSGIYRQNDSQVMISRILVLTNLHDLIAVILWRKFSVWPVFIFASIAMQSIMVSRGRLGRKHICKWPGYLITLHSTARCNYVSMPYTCFQNTSRQYVSKVWIGNYIPQHTYQYTINVRLNSSPPSAAYLRRQIGSALIQVMACRLSGTKPLPELMLTYCQLDP